MVSAFTAPQGTPEQEAGGGHGRSQYWGAEATGVPPRAPDLRWARCIALGCVRLAPRFQVRRVLDAAAAPGPHWTASGDHTQADCGASLVLHHASRSPGSLVFSGLHMNTQRHRTRSRSNNQTVMLL